MFSKGINTKYGTTSRDIRSLHLKACSQFNARLSDQNRNRLEVYAPMPRWKDSYVCTWSYRHRTLLEKEIPVTRDDGDQSVLSGGPAMLDSSAVSAWWSESYTVFYPQTVRISYHGSRIVVTNVRLQPYRSNPSDSSSNFRGRNSGGPAPSREPDGPHLVSRCITTACVRKEAGNIFRVRAMIIPLLPARSTTPTRYRAVVDSSLRTWRTDHTRHSTKPYTRSVGPY